MPKPTIDDIISTILHQPAPVIFLDTCIILDIVRVLHREGIDKGIIKSAKDLIVRSKDESEKIWLITSEIVETEWNDNIDIVVEDLEKEIRRLKNNMLRLESILKDVFPGTNIIYPDIAAYSLDDYLRSLSEKLLKSSIIFLNDQECLLKSTDRVFGNMAPASKGKSEPKDCMIIEHYIKISKHLRENSFREKRIFITSNKNDYGSPSDIKEPLNNEFDNVGLSYVNNMAWAISMINGARRQ